MDHLVFAVDGEAVRFRKLYKIDVAATMAPSVLQLDEFLDLNNALDSIGQNVFIGWR